MTRRSRILLALLIVVVAIGGGVALALRSPVVVGYWFERQARARFAEFTSRSDFGDDGLHGDGSDCRIDGVAAGSQHLEAGD